MAEHEFKAPADLPADGHEEIVAGPGALAGTWNACDQATRNLVRVVIAPKGNELTVHAFGACSPTPCDWGAVAGLAYAANVSSTAAIAFTAQYKFSFSTVIVAGVLDNGSLVVETFTHFTDKSGRSDYYQKQYMCKMAAKG
jgi:hypothetical protein